ncbi:MAG: hypothetical protein M3374_04850 [Pseudomonadota bacterium]|nr:hypothetical protein [Pseudomonadota bacterium]
MTGKKTTDKSKAKTKNRKAPTGGSPGNLHKHFDSERIADDIAAFEKSGGRVEKLGITQVLQKISPTADDVAKAAATAAPARKR